MDTNKTVVVLLVIAILFSLATVVIALGVDFDGFTPAGGETAPVDIDDSASGNVALNVLPSGGTG